MLGVQEGREATAGITATAPDRMDARAQSLGDAGHVDAAPSRIEVDFLGNELALGYDPIHRKALVDAGVERNGDDRRSHDVLGPVLGKAAGMRQGQGDEVL